MGWRIFMRPHSSFLLARGVRLHYLEWGPGREAPWLLLHGFTGSARQWQPLSPAWCPPHRLVALDQRGHGESAWTPGAYGLWDNVADIEALLAHLGSEPVVIVGHSMGGRHALLYALSHPERVSSLVLADARPGPDSEAAKSLEAAVQVLPHRVPSLDVGVEIIRTYFPDLAPALVRRLARYRWRRLPDGGLGQRHDPGFEEAVRAGGFFLEDLAPYLEHVSCPVLVIRGEESEVLSRAAASRLAAALPQGRLVEIPGAGHLVPWEQPQEFCRLVTDFVAEVSREK